MDREPMTKDKERDEALIAEARRREAIDRNRSHDDPRIHTSFEAHLIRLARENWTPPAKPDRYVEVWKEAYAAYTSQSLTKDGPDRAAAAVLRRHFEPSAEVKAMLETFSADGVDAQSRYVIVHQLRASAAIQDRETKRKTGWADTNDRACLMRSAADAIEAVADHILKGDQ